MKVEKRTSAFIVILVFSLVFSALTVTRPNVPILNSIVDSMQPKAFAEAGQYGGFYNYAFNETDAQSQLDEDFGATICLAEGSSYSLSTYFYTDGDLLASEDTEISFETVQSDGTPSPVVGIDPATQGYPDDTPLPIEHIIQLTAPNIAAQSETVVIDSTVSFESGQFYADELTIELIIGKAGSNPDGCGDALYADSLLAAVVSSNDDDTADSADNTTDEELLADTGTVAKPWVLVAFSSLLLGFGTLMHKARSYFL